MGSRERQKRCVYGGEKRGWSGGESSVTRKCPSGIEEVREGAAREANWNEGGRGIGKIKEQNRTKIKMAEKERNGVTRRAWSLLKRGGERYIGAEEEKNNGEKIFKKKGGNGLGGISRCTFTLNERSF